MGQTLTEKRGSWVEQELLEGKASLGKVLLLAGGPFLVASPEVLRAVESGKHA